MLLCSYDVKGARESAFARYWEQMMSSLTEINPNAVIRPGRTTQPPS
jgi:hypothetical protein